MPPEFPTDGVLLIDGRELARRLGVGISTIHALRRTGRFPLKPIRLGRAVRFRSDELSRWCAVGCPAANRWDAINTSPERRRTA